jgi:tRNA1Val (adenine37-N6)-methyltransferase
MKRGGFQFKQFWVRHDRCAMKVCTDACLLGAYTHAPSPQRILDVGAGTGLLGLMLAQRYPHAHIDAVEIDTDAFSQCQENIANSPWPNSVTPWQGRIQDFSPGQGYDLIVSNPPFYPNHLPSADPKRSMAMHTQTLSFADLIQSVQRLLLPDGQFFVLLPPPQMEQLADVARSAGLHEREKLLIADTPGKPAIRAIAVYTKEAYTHKIRTFCIKSSTGEYSEEFATLLKDYYLIF